MKETSTKYDPSKTEDKWYKYWLDNKLFNSTPGEREPFTIVIPPPNVTGVLHMGHIMNNTIQDILIRRARMQGKNACWVPGTDHASIATEAKVVNKLAEAGIEKNSISREEFLKHAWDWTHKHGGIILEQLKKLGASCDWDRTKFTLDDDLYESVIKVFIDLYNEGLIYRGVRMVNWDPGAKTAISDEEVEYKDEESKLYYVKYKIVESNDYITIATTRPETILGDSAVCIHPEDERYYKYHGKKAIIPLINREVPIIIDDYIDIEFGTGALKVTPAHDENDYKLGEKYNLLSFNIFNDDGTMSKDAVLYENKDRFEVRKFIIKDLEKAGNLVKIEDYTNRVGYSQRTQVPIEPKLSMQWFLKMEELVKPAIENVNNNTVRFSPERFKNTYNHWMENIRDWNISRQLWWGHRIPVYYLPKGNEFVVAENVDNALILAKEKTGDQNLTEKDLKQDEDVLDTWFSSWLWPISVFDGIRFPENDDINYYYPTNVLVTGHDIIFFWVARMIIAGYKFKNNFPFKDVYFTGMVRDEQRRRMSKQLGNSPDPLKLFEKFGADGVRFGMMLCSPAGGDLLYNDSLPEQGRNFSNKVWNAFRLTQSWEIDENIKQPDYAKSAVEWFQHKFNEQINVLDQLYSSFKLSEALMTVYKLFRDEFSSWLLEAVKPDYQKPVDAKTYNKIIDLFEKLLCVLHPFMPFITEEIWHQMKERKTGDSIMISEMPKAVDFKYDTIEKFSQTKDIITHLRNIRKEKNLPFKTKLDLLVLEGNGRYHNEYESILIRLGGINKILKTDKQEKRAVHFVLKKTEYFVPLGNIIDKDSELQKITSDLEYTKGFLNGVLKKLNNKRFVENAPAHVIEKEKTKQIDAEAKIKALEEQIKNLKQ